MKISINDLDKILKTLIPGYCRILKVTNITKNKQKEPERVLYC